MVITVKRERSRLSSSESDCLHFGSLVLGNLFYTDYIGKLVGNLSFVVSIYIRFE